MTSTPSIPDVLHDQPFFADLPATTIEAIAGCARIARFDQDARIIVADDAADVFYVVRTGRVALEIETPQRGPLVIETIGPGDVLGISWLLPPYRWMFGARAVEPTEALAIDAACLRARCDEDPALGYEMFKRFAGLVRGRLQATRLQLVDVYGHGDA